MYRRRSPAISRAGRVSLIGLALIMAGLVLFPASALAQQVTPGGNQPNAILQPISASDSRILNVPPPTGVASGFLRGYVALNTGPASLTTSDPTNEGIFALTARSASVEGGLQLGGVLAEGVLFQTRSSWTRITATYSAPEKSFKFNATAGTVYGVFRLTGARPQNSLPSSGDPEAPSSAGALPWGLLIPAGILLIGWTLAYMLRRRLFKS